MSGRRERGPRLNPGEAPFDKFKRLWVDHGRGSAKSWARAHYPNMADLWVRAVGTASSDRVTTGPRVSTMPEKTPRVQASGYSYPQGVVDGPDDPSGGIVLDWEASEGYPHEGTVAEPFAYSSKGKTEVIVIEDADDEEEDEVIAVCWEHDETFDPDQGEVCPVCGGEGELDFALQADTVAMFAYGMNMWSGGNGIGKNPRPALLDNWKLELRGFANIVPCTNEQVPGVIYDCTPAEMAALDVVEGVRWESPKHGLYLPITVSPRLVSNGEKVRCTAYMMTQYTRGKLVGQAPAVPYVATMLKGYREHQLPAAALLFALDRLGNGEKRYIFHSAQDLAKGLDAGAPTRYDGGTSSNKEIT